VSPLDPRTSFRLLITNTSPATTQTPHHSQCRHVSPLGTHTTLSTIRITPNTAINLGLFADSIAVASCGIKAPLLSGASTLAVFCRLITSRHTHLDFLANLWREIHILSRPRYMAVSFCTNTNTFIAVPKLITPAILANVHHGLAGHTGSPDTFAKPPPKPPTYMMPQQQH
jgi:hypothetical protein